MANDNLNRIKNLVLKELQDEQVEIALFGSFATGDSNRASDVDVAIIPTGNFKKSKLSLLREKLEEETIPYSVEIVDFSIVSEAFKKTALQNAKWWRK